ncbi:hypothetical protein [Streptococcus suis]|uniref:hypothetical protein n=1 Tax=Streptococcus suis TaxID=1307 RepID=UPI000CF5981D|nr:hypothetical protein [Streptococcus suis]MCK4074162.1 hypothetical protein [Streptococcus suis]MDD7565599.1 hypothetical protein [Streptococcus suis]MDY5055403.1 hypothetical protein [Streptococcus suis]HEM4694994.1 hypothetical protein [Streptococcus suis]HEM4859007.1 hypothetical protein [Streptococcus suis]
MPNDFLINLAFENVSKSLKDANWKESDEVVLFSLANKAQIQKENTYRLTDECQYYGERICIFAKQIKKNNYITLHKAMLENIIAAMEETDE